MGLAWFLASCLWAASKWTAVAVVLFVTYVLVQIAYNLYLHPLRAFPGPLANRATVLPKQYHLLSGDLPYHVANVHRGYGRVVRIAPNELAIIEPQAWKEIYARRPKDGPEVEHDMAFYNALGTVPTAMMASQAALHDPVRKLLNPGFSERAMRAQEPIIGGYVNLLMQRLQERHTNAAGTPQALNMRDWIAYTSFDIIGALTFGTDFGCLKDGDYHPWISLIMGSLKDMAVLHTLKALGILPPVKWLMGKLKLGDKQRQMHVELTGRKTAQRIEMGTGRDDFLDGLIKSGHEFHEVKQNAGLLVIAGSETAATLLTGAVFLLGTHAEVLERLAREVRGHFKATEEITLTSVNSLSYMLAVLNESLRVYPPVAITAPRVVPVGGMEIAGRAVPQGTTVGIWHWAMYHDPDLFADPEHFDPDRFVQLEEGRDAKYANDRLDCVNPFLVGPRNCIGQNLAYAEMRLILARLVYEFDIVLCDESKDWMKGQKNHLLWEKPVLNVYLKPVER